MTWLVLHALSIWLAVSLFLPRSGVAQDRHSAPSVRCTQLGTAASLPKPDSALGSAEWDRLATFAQGALFAIMAPRTVESFAQPVQNGQSGTSPELDSVKTCFSTRVIGEIGPVIVVQIFGDLVRASGPMDMHATFIALGPDGSITLLGQDTTIEAVDRNTPDVRRLGSVLSRYSLAGRSEQGQRERLQTAALLIGGAPDDLVVHRCRSTPDALVATVANGYETQTLKVMFVPEGELLTAERRIDATLDC